MERTSYYSEYIRQKWFQIYFDAKRKRGIKENMPKCDTLFSVTPTRHRNSTIKTFIKCCLLSESHPSGHRAPRPYLPQSNVATSAEEAGVCVCGHCSLLAS